MNLSVVSRAATGLLLVLCCMVESEAVQPGPEAHTDVAAGGTQGGVLDGTLDGILGHVWAAFDGAVKTVSHEVVTGVSGRFTEVQSQCLAQTGQLDQLSSELATVKTELEAELEAQYVVQAALNENLTLRLDGIESELSANSAQLAEVDKDVSAQTTELSRVQSELSAIRVQLEELSLTPPRDCSDLRTGSSSGVHLLRSGLGQPVPALCDQDTDGGGWTVIQRRADIKPRQDFFLGWQEYKWGFGELDAEFWWGLERLWLMTSQLDRRYELRIDMEDFEGESRHAIYQGFRISSEKDKYRLTAVNYTGDAGDSLAGHNGHPFSTKDRDNDIYGTSCAESFNGAWWYTKCHSSNLNGKYLVGKHESYANGVNWQPWKGYHYSLKMVTMKIRPTKKL